MTLTSYNRATRREEEGRTLTFDDVYQTYAETVARWVARLGGPGADVEDLTQEVFLVVDRRLPDFRGESRISTWLFAIAARVTANDRRRRRLRAWWTRLVPDAGERVPDAAETPIEELEKRERRAQFYAVLDALGERQRRVLVLFELEEMSIAEIAALIGLRAGRAEIPVAVPVVVAVAGAALVAAAASAVVTIIAAAAVVTTGRATAGAGAGLTGRAVAARARFTVGPGAATFDGVATGAADSVVVAPGAAVVVTAAPADAVVVTAGAAAATVVVDAAGAGVRRPVVAPGAGVEGARGASPMRGLRAEPGRRGVAAAS